MFVRDWVIVRTDLTDVTLVSDDTHGDEVAEDEGDEEDEEILPILKIYK